jgi:hypothetical protein
LSAPAAAEPAAQRRALLIHGDVLAVLRTLPAEAAHCCVTSPPYYGLRDYGLPLQVWGGVEGCRHEFTAEPLAVERGKGGNWQQAENGPGLRSGRTQTRYRGDTRAARDTAERATVLQGFCVHCGAWRGSLGLEPTPELYVEHLVAVFEEVRRTAARVLKSARGFPKSAPRIWIRHAAKAVSPQRNQSLAINAATMIPATPSFHGTCNHCRQCAAAARAGTGASSAHRPFEAPRMPKRKRSLQTSVDPATAARVRLHAERAGLSVSEWVADLLRRQVLHAGAADGLAARALETALTIGYMLRALMIDSLGAEATERVIEQAADAAADDVAAELTRAGELSP